MKAMVQLIALLVAVPASLVAVPVLAQQQTSVPFIIKVDDELLEALKNGESLDSRIPERIRGQITSVKIVYSPTPLPNNNQSLTPRNQVPINQNPNTQSPNTQNPNTNQGSGDRPNNQARTDLNGGGSQLGGGSRFDNGGSFDGRTNSEGAMDRRAPVNNTNNANNNANGAFGQRQANNPNNSNSGGGLQPWERREPNNNWNNGQSSGGSFKSGNENQFRNGSSDQNSGNTGSGNFQNNGTDRRDMPNLMERQNRPPANNTNSQRNQTQNLWNNDRSTSRNTNRQYPDNTFQDNNRQIFNNGQNNGTNGYGDNGYVNNNYQYNPNANRQQNDSLQRNVVIGSPNTNYGNGQINFPRQQTRRGHDFASYPNDIPPRTSGVNNSTAVANNSVDQGVPAASLPSINAHYPTIPLSSLSMLERDEKYFWFLWFLLFCSIGLNFYLGWISRNFYVRYSELADELRETFSSSI